MKRSRLLKHLIAEGCLLLREGKKHTIFWNPDKQLTSSIPRHVEIDDWLAQKICRDLGLEPMSKKS